MPSNISFLGGPKGETFGHEDMLRKRITHYECLKSVSPAFVKLRSKPVIRLVPISPEAMLNQRFSIAIRDAKKNYYSHKPQHNRLEQHKSLFDSLYNDVLKLL